MLFATTELAARIERAECDLLTASVRAVIAERGDAGRFVVPLAGGVATRTDEGSPLNKVAGLGFAGPVDPDELERVELLFAAQGSPVQVELSCLADPSVGVLLTERGYRLVGFENVLGRALSEVAFEPVERPGITIETSGGESFHEWLDVVVTGFAHPDQQGLPSHESYPREALEQVLGDVARADGLVRYLARRDAEAAGAASVRIGNGIAQLCGAATVPAHRRRGVQAALLERRLMDAVRAGCTIATVTTQPGSQSQQNVQRKGFELLYTRAVLVRE